MSEEHESQDESPPIDDIELAYREALKSIDEAELQVGSALMELSDDTDDDDTEEAPFASIGKALADDLASVAESSETVAETDEDAIRISPRAVIEGALFVGGDTPLTARRLASLIGRESDARLAVTLIDQLNSDYEAEKRPYEIRLHEGGFRLELKREFSDVQARVFGLGPREVRLSPEALEVLAFVAYNQPVAREDLSESGRQKAQTIVRQLIRLKLVEVERTGKRRSDIAYRTGQRFLDLFGLADLDELPQADVFNIK